MKLSLSNLWKKLKNLLGINANSPQTIADYNREALINQGRDQFKKLIEKGLNIPVALL
ncbi:MAG TPA: hypothetical protein VNA13_03700 [Xanthomonadales bacterium]|nr:hypothetical protein [Xanthomonadales bacterium]